MPTEEAQEKSTEHFWGGKAQQVRQHSAPHCEGQMGGGELQNSCSLVTIVIQQVE